MNFSPFKPTLYLVSALFLASCSSSGDGDSPLELAEVDVQTEIDQPPGATTDTTTETDLDSDQISDTDTEPGNPPVVIESAAFGEPGICTTAGINAWVDTQMRDYYIYFDQVPVVDPSDYDTPAALLADLRVQPDVYSSILPQAERTALFDEGETFGFGFSLGRDQQSALRFSNIVSGSPMNQAGILRGDRLLAINGIPELDITDNLFDQIFGELGDPTAVTFTIARGNEALRDVTVTSATYTINTVAEVRTYDINGTKVGYIESSRFLRTSEAEIDRAIETMFEENPSDVILDFRYNGGGFVFVAQKFAAQLVGRNFVGRTFQSTSFNRNYEQFNRTALLEEQDIHLDLSRVIILTTNGTASASEAIANNLRPYIDVVLIGDRTRGKPFASVANPNCDMLLNAMDRITSNDVGETVLGGIPATCEVSDNFLYPQSSPEDALLGGALHYIETSTCPVATAFDQIAEFRASFIRAPIDTYTESPMPNGVFDSIELP